MTETILRIDYAPISLNKLVRNWRIRHRERDTWAQLLTADISAASRNKLACLGRDKKKVRVLISVYHPRLFDEDNLRGSCKPIFDAMKKVGYIYDDRPAFLEQYVTQSASLTRWTFIGIREA